ncbi:DEAD/DEAH box helicase [Candidatus Woesearchaeota archaeon]|nr:DEAD/DEAH box helicase [Candidatus Woesearchaeota archaeon]
MLKEFKPRLYQQTIFNTTAKYNTLVVLPTGLGKTAISMMLASQRLQNYPQSKILVLAPTKPLVEQHLQTFRQFMDISEDSFVLFTGLVKPDKRQELWKNAKVIFSTPQGLENDIISNRIDIRDVSLIVFDEAHRAVKGYSYVWVADRYMKIAKYPRILGLTASPGSDVESIVEVCRNLCIEEVELRTDKDEDVKPYVQEVEVEWIPVELSEELKVVRKYLLNCYKAKLKDIEEYGVVQRNLGGMSKKELISLQAHLHGSITRGDKTFPVLKSVSLLAEALKVEHALELLETQDINSLKNYFDNLKQQAISSKVQAVKNLVKDVDFRNAAAKNDLLIENNVKHPKLIRLKQILAELSKKKDFKIIIFTQFRDTGAKIVEEIKDIEGVNAKLFVGQQKRAVTGMSQKQQIEVLQKFRDGEFNTVVMTSVGEEGLDIPSVDQVIFYEPIPSAIRTIQRRGRTGRLEKGKVSVLVTKGTRDEAYRWSSHHKEKRMHRILKDIKSKIGADVKKQESLGKYVTGEGVLVFADHREKSNSIVKQMIDFGCEIRLSQLDSADYVVSDRVGIELKTVKDFVDSIIDGRLLGQLGELRRNYDRPLIIIEGEEDIYSMRRIHPNAIRGMLANVSISYGIPILYTKNPKETASLIWLIARREQEKRGKDFSPHSMKKAMTITQQQEYIVSSFPNIGPVVAEELLRYFGSIKKIVNADLDELEKVEKVGKKKAKDLKELFEKTYEK